MRPHGLRQNLGQFAHQLLQVLLVGFTLGMMRTVVPALAESEFGLPRGSFVLLASFVVAFGVVKGALNFAAGRLAERLGRRRVLLVGWLVALPIPAMVLWGPSWSWIVAATVLLGVNQGLTWSMTQTAKLDLTRTDERGLAIGLNEFAGYVGVAAAGIVTAYLAAAIGPRPGVAFFGLAVILAAIVLTVAWVEETQAWAQAEAAQASEPGAAHASTWEIFARVTWRDPRFMAVSQAGLVEKFVDALVWVLFPAYLYSRGIQVAGIGWVVGTYGFVWGGAQLVTGRLSDRLGRYRLNVAGMWLCGAGVGLAPLIDHLAWWTLSAALAGLGMAILYPNLSAAVADLSHPAWRASAIGIYRFWRDLGYAVGALGIGLVAAATGTAASGFVFVAAAMLLSGAVLAVFGEETHPRLRRR
jgi:MFS family permease